MTGQPSPLLAESATYVQLGITGTATYPQPRRNLKAASGHLRAAAALQQATRRGSQAHRLRSKECEGSAPLLHRADVESFGETGRTQRGPLFTHRLWPAMDR